MNPAKTKKVMYFELLKNRFPALDDLSDLKDKVARSRIDQRIERAGLGNYGSHRRFSDLVELIADFGPGYRVYLGEDGSLLIIILVVGDKSTQDSDFREARAYWEAYKARKRRED